MHQNYLLFEFLQSPKSLGSFWLRVLAEKFYFIKEGLIFNTTNLLQHVFPVWFTNCKHKYCTSCVGRHLGAWCLPLQRGVSMSQNV